MGDLMRQVIVVVWPGLGIGAAEEKTDKRAELQQVATYVGKLEAPTLAWLGLGNVASIRGVEPATPPAASHGRVAAEGQLDALIGDAARALVASGRQVHLVGGAADTLQIQGAVAHAQNAQSALERAADLVQSSQSALVVAAPGHDEHPTSASPVTAARAVQRLDAELARLFDRLQGREDVLVLLTSTASGGQARVPAPGTGPSLQWAPVLAHLGALPSGIALGDRMPSDLGATAAEALGASTSSGQSFLAELLA